MEDDVVNVWENAYYDFLLLRRTSAGRLMLLIEDDDVPVLSVTSSTALTPNAWHHVVVTQDGSGARIYVDGVDAGASGSNAAAWTGHLGIEGAWLGRGHCYGLSGALDEVRIYDRSLSADEVARHHSGDFSDGRGLLAHWTFDDPVDAEAGAWFSDHYPSDFAASSSWELLQFLPVFARPDVRRG